MKNKSSEETPQVDVLEDTPGKFVWTNELLVERLSGDLVEIERLLQGKILTIIDTLGFDEKRNKAVKDLVKSAIRQSLVQQANAMEWFIDSIENQGYEKRPSNVISGGGRKLEDYPYHMANQVYPLSESVL